MHLDGDRAAFPADIVPALGASLEAELQLCARRMPLADVAAEEIASGHLQSMALLAARYHGIVPPDPHLLRLCRYDGHLEQLAHVVASDGA